MDAEGQSDLLLNSEDALNEASLLACPFSLDVRKRLQWRLVQCPKAVPDSLGHAVEKQEKRTGDSGPSDERHLASVVWPINL